MFDFSSIVPETYQNISFGYVEVLIQERRQELFLGLMRISYQFGENLVFLFLDGVQQNLYRCFESTTEIVNRQSWLPLLDRPAESVGFLSLGVDGLRLIRLIHEAPVLHTEQSDLSHNELIDQVGAWVDNPEPGCMYISSGNIHRIYVFVGKPNLMIEGLSVQTGQARFSTEDTSFPQALPNTDYKISLYGSRAEHDAWREYKLRQAFHSLMQMLISRFSEFAGRILAERLGDQLTNWVSAGGWNVSINNNGVVNQQYFDSLEQATSVYSGILRQFRNEAGLAVGPRLVEIMLRETLVKLPPNVRDIVNQYIYGQLISGSAVPIAQKEVIPL